MIRLTTHDNNALECVNPYFLCLCVVHSAAIMWKVQAIRPWTNSKENNKTTFQENVWFVSLKCQCVPFLLPLTESINRTVNIFRDVFQYGTRNTVYALRVSACMVLIESFAIIIVIINAVLYFRNWLHRRHSV